MAVSARGSYRRLPCVDAPENGMQGCERPCGEPHLRRREGHGGSDACAGRQPDCHLPQDVPQVACLQGMK